MDDATKKMIANLESKTGRSMSEWVSLALDSGEEKHGKVVAWLKTDQGLTHGYANLVAHTALKSAASTSGESADALILAQYKGKKAALKPIYDRLAAALSRLGNDVELAPKKAYVSLRRNKQFGLIQPSTATRVDVGLVLKGKAPGSRLELAGSWNTMMSHRVRVGSSEEIDEELVALLTEAYQLG